MFAATRVMAAGKAGLESLPYFVDELMGQGIPQLAPWAADHSQEQIDILNKTVGDRRHGPWRSIYGIGEAEGKLGIRLNPDTMPSERLLHHINPHASGNTHLADHPALMGTFCRINIWQYCRDTLRLWDGFKRDNGLTDENQFAVIIPYCPEGPTSGTLGIYLAAALRKVFDENRVGDQLVIWGIELCPAIDRNYSEPLNEVSMRSVFRGYVSRDELLREEGLPLTDNPEDTGSWKPFDIMVVFDGGTTRDHFHTDNDAIHAALDRAAAQTTACLISGAIAGDSTEATNWLREGRRWNACLVHVVSELSYREVYLYLKYLLRLPWERDPDGWQRANIRQRKERFRTCVEHELRPMLQHEKHEGVRQRVESLAEFADRTAPYKHLSKLWETVSPHRRRANDLIQDAIRRGEDDFRTLSRDPQERRDMVALQRPFCINITFPGDKAKDLAKSRMNADRPLVISDYLGNGNNIVREHIVACLTKVWRRTDCLTPQSDSQAHFEQIVLVNMGDSGASSNNQVFRPPPEIVRDFIAAERQNLSGTLNYKEFPEESRRGVLPDKLNWKVEEAEFDIPVDFTIIGLARCRASDGFSDVSTYDDLKEVYDQVSGDRTRLQEFARYFSVLPPNELMPSTSRMADSVPPQPDAQNNGYNAVNNLPEGEVAQSEAQVDAE